MKKEAIENLEKNIREIIEICNSLAQRNLQLQGLENISRVIGQITNELLNAFNQQSENAINEENRLNNTEKGLQELIRLCEDIKEEIKNVGEIDLIEEKVLQKIKKKIDTIVKIINKNPEEAINNIVSLTNTCTELSSDLESLLPRGWAQIRKIVDNNQTVLKNLNQMVSYTNTESEGRLNFRLKSLLNYFTGLVRHIQASEQVHKIMYEFIQTISKDLKTKSVSWRAGYSTSGKISKLGSFNTTEGKEVIIRIRNQANEISKQIEQIIRPLGANKDIGQNRNFTLPRIVDELKNEEKEIKEIINQIEKTINIIKAHRGVIQEEIIK
ncbi:MAG: hypothetical protein QXK37_04890 [Candidatus Woesearchaeota archaeon]